ncbi:hypothetical protein INR49_011396, partial [Caranx melampygus]
TTSLPQTSCSSSPSSPHEYWGINASKEGGGRDKERGERWKKGRGRDGGRDGGADIVRGLGIAHAQWELGWMPIDWKTTGCGRTDKGGCGLTGEERDTDRSSDHAAIFTPPSSSSPLVHPGMSGSDINLTGDTMEAPLVCLDEEFEDLRPCRMDELDHPALDHPSYSTTTTTTTIPLAPISREDFSELENFSEMMSFKSMEDLVNEFDEKLNVCFHNYNTKTEGLAPIRNQSHNQEDEERLQDEDVWDALTDNYISTWDGPDSEGLNGNMSDHEIHEKEEEEMNEKNDNAKCLNEEPLITADQVIEEIVEMMENSPDPGETEEEDEEESSHCSTRTSPSLLEEIRQLSLASNNNCSYEGLSLMPSSALVELLHRVEAAIREYSEELVSQLARRDELEFEKEVKNTFITALMEVQNRQKEQRDSSKRRRRDKALSLQGGMTLPVNGGNTGSTDARRRQGPCLSSVSAWRDCPTSCRRASDRHLEAQGVTNSF